MENAGQVNCYRCHLTEPNEEDPGPIYTINLADGVTPFIHFFPDVKTGREYRSECYRLKGPVRMTVTHAFYRPSPSEYNTLARDVKLHVLNGGLLLESLRQAVDRQCSVGFELAGTMEFEEFQEQCKLRYGERLTPLW